MGEFFKKFWWLFVLIIVILLLIIAWLIWFEKGKKDTATPTATTSASQEATTASTPSSQKEDTESDEELLKKAVSEKTGIALDVIIVSVDQNTGQHAKGTVTAEGETVGGGYWLAVNDKGTWLVVFDGQSTPQCSIVDPPGFPADMVPECFDSSGNIDTRS